MATRALLTAAAAAGAAATAATPIRPDPSTTFGAWEGWGVSLSWFANVFGGRDDLAAALYALDNATVALTGHSGSVTLPGLGFSIARYNAGGTAYAPVNGASVQLSKSFPAWKQIQGFWITPTTWNFSVDANQLAFTQAVQRANADVQLELFSNSPMWWMLQNHNPSGSNDGGSDNLDHAYLQQHAHYMAQVAAQFKALHGLVFRTVEAFNEPVANWWKASGTQEGCHFDYATQADVLLRLRGELDAAGLRDTLVAASDESLTDQALAGWLSFNASVRGTIDRFNLHGYQGTAGNRSGVYAEVAQAGGKPIRLSEHGEGDDSGAQLAAALGLDMAFLHPTSWVYWQALDSYNWGLLDSDVGAGTIAGATTKWFVLAQYTRHIRPGDVILRVTDGGASATVAAFNAAAGTATIVAFNPSSSASLDVDVDLTGFAAAAGPVESWLTVAVSGASAPRYAYQGSRAVGGQGFKATLAPLAVQTFVVHGVTAPALHM